MPHILKSKVTSVFSFGCVLCTLELLCWPFFMPLGWPHPVTAHLPVTYMDVFMAFPNNDASNHSSLSSGCVYAHFYLASPNKTALLLEICLLLPQDPAPRASQAQCLWNHQVAYAHILCLCCQASLCPTPGCQAGGGPQADISTQLNTTQFNITKTKKHK